MSTSDDTAGRSRNATTEALLAAARARFATEGYDRTTIRAVARDVGVDAALVIRYFGSKEGLFSRAADLDLGLPDLTGVRAGEVTGLVTDRLLDLAADGTFLALLRAASTGEPAATALRDVLTRQLGSAVAAVTDDRLPERAALLASTLLGFATAREVLRLAPLADLTRAEARDWLGPAVRQCLLD